MALHSHHNKLRSRSRGRQKLPLAGERQDALQTEKAEYAAEHDSFRFEVTIMIDPGADCTCQWHVSCDQYASKKTV